MGTLGPPWGPQPTARSLLGGLTAVTREGCVTVWVRETLERRLPRAARGVPGCERGGRGSNKRRRESVLARFSGAFLVILITGETRESRQTAGTLSRTMQSTSVGLSTGDKLRQGTDRDG